MKPSNILLMLCVAVMSMASQCNKKPVDPYSDNGLPPATQTGANIFACKVNRQNWIAKNFRNNILGYNSNDTLVVSGANPETTSYMELFFIRINHLIAGQQVYRLNDTLKYYAEFVTNKKCFSNTRGLDVGNGKCYDGEINFTKIDKTNKILSGTFWFNIDTDYCNTLKITDGRFDIKYH